MLTTMDKINRLIQNYDKEAVKQSIEEAEFLIDQLQSNLRQRGFVIDENGQIKSLEDSLKVKPDKATSKKLPT